MQLSGPAALRDGAEEPAAQEAANGAAGKGDGDAADGE